MQQRESFYSQSQVGSTMGSPAATPSPAPESIAWGAALARPQPSAAAAGPGGAGAVRQHSFRGPLSPPPPSSSNPSERAWQQQHQQPQRQNEPDLPEPARTTTSSLPDDVSISNASELEVTEWVIQDEPGVYITVRELADGARELRRVRFRSKSIPLIQHMIR